MSKEILDIMKERRSIRRYKDRPVPPELVRSVLETACLAPSAHNAQPWRFSVISRTEKKRAMARAMAVRFADDMRKEDVPFWERVKKLRRSISLISRAPVIVVLCLDRDTVKDGPYAEYEHLLAVQSVALAGGHILLAAQAEGLGACWFAAPMFCADAVREQLNIPESAEPQGLIMMGYSAEEPSARDIIPLDEIWRHDFEH